MIIGGYLVIGAIGSTLIGCAVAERVLAVTHRFRGADLIAKSIGNTLPWALIAGALWALMHTPFF